MKKNEKVKNIVLAIETSVQGGSISLIENEEELDFWHGSGNISKSEDILDELLKLLTKNKVEKNQIGQIVISRGPGSFTGTRIGLAIGLGLKKSLNCEIYGVSVLEAMALRTAQSISNKRIIAAIPLGTKVCVQEFKIGQKRELKTVVMPYLESFEKFIKQIQDDLESGFGLQEKLYNDVLANIEVDNQIIKRIINSGENLAYLIGLLQEERFISNNLQPIYIKHTT